jgi:hypothetical protein
VESAKSGARVMVKLCFFFFTTLAFSTGHAGFLVGMSSSSWQETIPLSVDGIPVVQLASFSSFGLQTGFDFLINRRVRYGIIYSYLPGQVDIHKLSNTVSPRRRFIYHSLTNKLHWRKTKTFSFGPNVSVNSGQIDGLNRTVNLGLYLDFDFDLSNRFRLTQSLGTVSDSRKLAYSLNLFLLF